MKNSFFSCLLLFISFACQQRITEDELLWKYYETFSYPPAEVEKLQSKAQSKETKLFLAGLVCMEEFDLTNDTQQLNQAQLSFNKLIQEDPENYMGYLGHALAYTEWGTLEKKDSLKRTAFFKKAFYNFRQANDKRTQFAPILYYWARALYFQNPLLLNDSSLLLLEEVTHLKRGFFKAHERAAQFLANYANSNDRNIRDALIKRYPDLRKRIQYHFNESLKGDSSWYQTYEGIADAKTIYTPYERVHYLEKGIGIAQKQKSKDTSKLIQKKYSIFLNELSNYDMLDDLSYQDNLSISESDMLAETNFYFDTKDSTNLRTTVASNYFYAQYWGNKNVDSAIFYFDKAIKLEVDTLNRVKIKFEKAKYLWPRQPARALIILNQLKEQLAGKPGYYPIYNRVYYLREYIFKNKQLTAMSPKPLRN